MLVEPHVDCADQTRKPIDDSVLAQHLYSRRQVEVYVSCLQVSNAAKRNVKITPERAERLIYIQVSFQMMLIFTTDEHTTLKITLKIQLI